MMMMMMMMTTTTTRTLETEWGWIIQWSFVFFSNHGETLQVFALGWKWDLAQKTGWFRLVSTWGFRFNIHWLGPQVFGVDDVWFFGKNNYTQSWDVYQTNQKDGSEKWGMFFFLKYSGIFFLIVRQLGCPWAFHRENSCVAISSGGWATNLNLENFWWKRQTPFHQRRYSRFLHYPTCTY